MIREWADGMEIKKDARELYLAPGIDGRPVYNTEAIVAELKERHGEAAEKLTPEKVTEWANEPMGYVPYTWHDLRVASQSAPNIITSEMKDQDESWESIILSKIERSQVEEVTDQTGGRSEFYREITPTSFWGGVRPGYIEAVAITTKVDAIEAMLHNRQIVEHTEEIGLKLTPQQARSLVKWLLNNLKTYESIYGKIKTSEEVGPPKELPNQITYSEIDELLK